MIYHVLNTRAGSGGCQSSKIQLGTQDTTQISMYLLKWRQPHVVLLVLKCISGLEHFSTLNYCLRKTYRVLHLLLLKIFEVTVGKIWDFTNIFVVTYSGINGIYLCKTTNVIKMLCDIHHFSFLPHVAKTLILLTFIHYP